MFAGEGRCGCDLTIGVETTSHLHKPPMSFRVSGLPEIATSTPHRLVCDHRVAVVEPQPEGGSSQLEGSVVTRHALHQIGASSLEDVPVGREPVHVALGLGEAP